MWVLGKKGRGESDFSQDLSLPRRRKLMVPRCSGTSSARLGLVFRVSVDIRHWQKPCGFLTSSPGPRKQSPEP